MDEDLPIDIHYNKLLDINYFHCLEIMRLLKLTEDNHKNIFGRYSSQRLKDWAEILKLYEKDDLYLAEAAQLLARNVNYEVPSLKKQIAKSIHSQQEYLRKEVEHAKASADLHESYAATCRKMGIEGKKLRREILHLVRDLPSAYEDVAQRIQMLNAAMQYYTEFVAFLLSRSDVCKDCLPLLHFVAEHGNVTMFEWQSGRRPKRVEAAEVDFDASDDEDEVDIKDADNGEIDWGDIGDSSDTAGIPAVDVNIESLNEAAIEGIDWSAVDDLGCGIELEVSGDARHQPVHSDSSHGVDGDDVARGPDAVTLLDNTDTRNQIVDELMELESFLEQRVTESSGDSSDDVVAAAIMQIAPASIHVDVSRLTVMLADVAGVRERLTSPHMRDLILIRSSPRYVDRLTANLRKLTSDANKMTSMSRLMSTRHSEAVDEHRQLEPQLDLLRQRTKELQQQIEGEISKRYKNRRVNIMGEINTI